MKFPLCLPNRHTVQNRQTLAVQFHVYFTLALGGGGSRWAYYTGRITPAYRVLRCNVFIKSDKLYMI